MSMYENKWGNCDLNKMWLKAKEEVEQIKLNKHF